MNSQQLNLHALLRNALFLLIASQSILWLALAVAESKGRPDALPEPASLQMFFTDESGKPIPGKAPIAVQIVAEPGYIYLDRERHPGGLFVHHFDLNDIDVQRGVMLGWDRRIAEVRLNNWPLKTQAPVDIWGILGGHDSVVYTFPEDYLQTGRNTLEFLNTGLSRKIMPYFFVGELAELYAANTWLRMFSVDLLVISIGVLLFTILLCALISWPERDKIRARCLIILLAAWTIRNLTFLGIDGSLPDPFRLLSHFIVTYAFLFAFLGFALGWTRSPRKWFMFPIAGFSLSVLAAAIATLHSEQKLFEVAFLLETVATLSIGLVSLWLFVVYWTRSNRAETVEIILFLVCAGAVVVDAIDDRWKIAIPFFDIPLTFYAAPMCGILLALGMVASLAAQSTRARVATDNVNELLRSKLQEQEERLSESYEREKQIENQKVLVDERQRIIRDMHDGVGGSLMSLLLRARRDDLSKESLIRTLSASMNDLRLIIDSFDHVGDNLEFALSVFRQRVEPELLDNGVTLHYETSAGEAIAGFGPEAVLQIYRILQESCNNAVNHGDARNIRIELSTDIENQCVVISVSDDGIGFDSQSVRKGRGLANMQHRAEVLGGTLTIQPNDPGRGTNVLLKFPMRTGK